MWILINYIRKTVVFGLTSAHFDASFVKVCQFEMCRLSTWRHIKVSQMAGSLKPMINFCSFWSSVGPQEGEQRARSAHYCQRGFVNIVTNCINLFIWKIKQKKKIMLLRLLHCACSRWIPLSSNWFVRRATQMIDNLQWCRIVTFFSMKVWRAYWGLVQTSIYAQPTQQKTMTAMYWALKGATLVLLPCTKCKPSEPECCSF